jgi:steroid delta-isomerase-like uncharacterized protein
MADHRALTQRFYDEVMNEGRLDVIDELLADDFVEHEEIPGLEPTREGVKAFFRMYVAAFPDLRFEAEDMLVSGDKVVTRARVTGTHQGEFMGIPATGKRIDIPVIDIIRFGDDGLGREHWGVLDSLKMMEQLGVVPAGAPA